MRISFEWNENFESSFGDNRVLFTLFFLLGTFKLVNENKSGLMNLSDCLNSLREETLTSLNIDGVYYCDVPVIFNLIGVS